MGEREKEGREGGKKKQEKTMKGNDSSHYLCHETKGWGG